jgi:hypothetical protein
MRLIERLVYFLEQKDISAYAFEKTLGLSNGYLGKQLRAKGAVGSDILERISEHYPEISLDWLITGRGRMIRTGKAEPYHNFELKEDPQVYKARERLVEKLKAQLKVLEEPKLSTKRKK